MGPIGCVMLIRAAGRVENGELLLGPTGQDFGWLGEATLPRIGRKKASRWKRDALGKCLQLFRRAIVLGAVAMMIAMAMRALSFTVHVLHHLGKLLLLFVIQ